MKQLLTFLLAVAVFASCQQDPQEHADKKADELNELAQSEAGAADAQLEQARENANSAVAHATQAEMNEAIKKIDVPEFENNRANELVKKLGNHGIEFINANDFNQADKYRKLIEGDLKQLNKLEENGKISIEDAQRIRQYGQDVADAVSIKVQIIAVVDTNTAG